MRVSILSRSSWVCSYTLVMLIISPCTMPWILVDNEVGLSYLGRRTWQYIVPKNALAGKGLQAGSI